MVDLFAGAGGTSTGVALACKELGRKVDLTAINHWHKAIETHSKNHPWAKHICMNVEAVDPRAVVLGQHLHGLVASPECTHFSRAAGGRPKLDQKRSSAWQILRWLELIRIDFLLVENVTEFADWGPLDSTGFPIKEKKGLTFKAWIEAIKSYGYNVEMKILNAADYGAATSRSRLFIVARKKDTPMKWPAPTHSRAGNGRKKWRAAREIIDWSVEGESIFSRKKPLSQNTIRRIITGLKKFGSQELQPFIVLMEHGGGLRDLGKPLPTITTARGDSMALVHPFFASVGLVEPFILSQGSGGAPRSTNEPVMTLTANGTPHLIEPYIVQYHGNNKGKNNGDRRVRSLDEPLATIDTSKRYAIAQPFILPNEGFFQDAERSHNPPKSCNEPLGTITQRGAGSLVESYIIQQNHNSLGRSIEQPLPSMTTNNKLGLVESHLIQYNGCSGPQSIDEPLGTIPTKERFALVQPVVNGKTLDIKFRMLQPHELARAMGFPKNYKFSGTKTDVVKQIGNAVVVNVSKALCKSLLMEVI